MLADLMFRKNEYDQATFHFQQLLERAPGNSLFNSCTAEFFVSIFQSFKAGIANTISSFKWMKNDIIYET